MKRQIAAELLKIKAVNLQPDDPFTWASGIKSPIYCDNRLTLSYPGLRKQIEKGLMELILDKFPGVEMIMGTATAGIAHAALVAELLGLPMGYVRSSVKSHGKENQIEGVITKSQKVVVVEDLISTGKSAIEVVKALRKVGFNVLGVVSIFSYNLELGNDNFKNENLVYYSLTDYHTLIKVALEKDYIKEEDLVKLVKWRKNPENPDWIN